VPERWIAGCDYASGRARRLTAVGSVGTAAGSGRARVAALTGSLVAIEESVIDEVSNTQTHVIKVWNLHEGRLLRRVPTGEPAEPGDEGAGPTTDVVMTPAGRLAWIVRTEPGRHTVLTPTTLQVYASDSHGSRVLATTDVAPQSLALARNTIYWTAEGKPFETTLG